MKPRGAKAIMAERVEAPDSLDYFPTPPWATRALLVHVLRSLPRNLTAWDPACGEGHMAEVLLEHFREVMASDVFNYGKGAIGRKFWRGKRVDQYEVLDFLSRDVDNLKADWIISNPPFKAALAFTLRALELAHCGIAMLVRTQWLESSTRYRVLFKDHPPTVFAPFVERVPMVKGCWDLSASTATSYAWFVWDKAYGSAAPMLKFIPPGCRENLARPDDVRRFSKQVPAPLLEGAA